MDIQKFWAYADLATGILLIASLLIPDLAVGIVDARTGAVLGFIVILLFAGRGFGIVVGVVLIKVAYSIAHSSRSDKILSLAILAERSFTTFIVSYLEGLVLMIISSVIIVPAMLLISVSPAKSYYMEKITPIAEQTLGGFVGGNVLMGYILAVTFTAFSFFSLYLLKVWDFSIWRYYMGFRSKNAGAEYEKMLQAAKGKEVRIF